MPPLRIRKPLTPPVPHHHHHHGVPQRPRQGTRSLERIGGLPLQEGRRPLEEWEKVVSVKKFCWELLCGSFSSGPPPFPSLLPQASAPRCGLSQDACKNVQAL